MPRALPDALGGGVSGPREAALERVRKGALALREQGRIWPVQEVVFHQFLFARDGALQRPERPRGDAHDRAERLARARARPSADAWARAALPDATRSAHICRAIPATRRRAQATGAGRFLWLGETRRPAIALPTLWRGGARPGLPPLGRPTPIFPPPDGAPRPSPTPSPPPIRRAAWVTHWTPT